MNSFEIFSDEINSATGCIAEALQDNEFERTREFVRDLIGFIRIKFAFFEQEIGFAGGRFSQDYLDCVHTLLEWCDNPEYVVKDAPVVKIQDYAEAFKIATAIEVNALGNLLAGK